MGSVNWRAYITNGSVCLGDFKMYRKRSGDEIHKIIERGRKKKWCVKKISRKWGGDAKQRWSSKDQDVASNLRERGVDAAGGRWREIMSGNIALSQIASPTPGWDWSANLLLPSLYTLFSCFFAVTCSRRGSDISLLCLSRAGDSVGSRGSGLGLDAAGEDYWPSGGRERPPRCTEPAGQQAGRPGSICQSPARPVGRPDESPHPPSLPEIMSFGFGCAIHDQALVDKKKSAAFYTTDSLASNV